MSEARELSEVTILLVEDEPSHAELICYQLEDVGIRNTIVRLRDGQEAWDFLTGTGPGQHRNPAAEYALILDLHMPRLDGFELLRLINGHAELRSLPVVVLTTTDNPSEVAACARLGCSDFFVKPLDAMRFLEALTKLGLSCTIHRVPRRTARHDA